MGSILSNCCPNEPREDKPKKNKDIVRFFMVGTGAAGKTTVIRQLKCLCKERPNNYKVYDEDWNRIPIDSIFSESEMARFRKIIQNNILTAVYNLIQQTNDWESNYKRSKSAESIVTFVEQADIDNRDLFTATVPSSLRDDLIDVLRDHHINETLQVHHKMAREWRLEDGTLKFLDESQIRRVFDESAELTTTDIVHLRYPTTGIQDFKFSIDGTYIQIHDMGGQPTEMMQVPVHMQQWIDNDQEGYTNFVLFVTSMADFNRILSVSAIGSCGLLIFYNKQDRFDSIVTALARTDEGRKELCKYLGDTLKEADRKKLLNGNCPLETLRDAVANKYEQVISEKKKRDGTIFSRYTQAIDPTLMADIFHVIQSKIINDFFKRIQFI
ncbi:unnamed protein product [Nippostrongylus brasiliensis]|uniref:G-protein alpha subunit n=1 Tax=Nippostrongylus brasiliensis TaxID=27835 RepID=A0A0N4Y937_NIPBR|nr:unnamed protein product [Nippostrongylus brasiliensis]